MNIQYRKDAATGGKWTFYQEGKAIPRADIDSWFAGVLKAIEEKKQAQQQIIAGLNYELAEKDQQLEKVEKELAEIYAALNYAELRIKRLLEVKK